MDGNPQLIAKDNDIFKKDWVIFIRRILENNKTDLTEYEESEETSRKLNPNKQSNGLSLIQSIILLVVIIFVLYFLLKVVF